MKVDFGWFSTISKHFETISIFHFGDDNSLLILSDSVELSVMHIRLCVLQKHTIHPTPWRVNPPKTFNFCGNGLVLTSNGEQMTGMLLTETGLMRWNKS